MAEVRQSLTLLQLGVQVLLVNQELLLVVETDNSKLYRLLINAEGYGNKGDTVSLIRRNGDLWLVSNGVKQFSIDRVNLTICPTIKTTQNASTTNYRK